MRCVLALACLASPALADSVEPPPPPPARSFFGLGFSFGLARRHTPTGIETGEGLMMEGGLALSQQLVLVLGMDGEEFDSTDVEPEHVMVRAGLRWYPFGRHRSWWMSRRHFTDFAALHIEERIGVDVGGTRPNAMGNASEHDGFLFGGSIGWMPFQGEDWALGFEYAVTGTRLRDEYQHDYDLMVVAEVY